MRERFAALGGGLKRALSAAGDLILLNLLFLLCCIPVFTAGAAKAACYSYMFRMLRKEETGLSPAGFFRDFAAGFKRATLGFLIELGCLLLLAGDLWFAVVYSEPDNVFFLVFSIVLGAGVLLADVWFYPLVAGYENKLGAHLKNAVLMAFARFPRSVLALLVQAAFLAVPFLFFDAFVYFGWFWLLFGASLPMYLSAKLLEKSLRPQTEKTQSDAETKTDG